MLSTQNIVTELSEVPSTWIFEHYLQLSEKLTGQDLKIKSVFNPSDKTPSMFVFYSHQYQSYKFKDFSTGNSGNALRLVQDLLGYSMQDARNKIVSDYAKFIESGGSLLIEEIETSPRYKLKHYKTREWNNLDVKYWLDEHKIDSKMLNRYNVKPLAYYELSNESREFKVVRELLYGFFKNNGELYKIYVPYSKVNKFFKVKSYVMGYEQLTFKSPYLLILSSLKDIMAFNMMKIKGVECIAPDSENTLITPKQMDWLKKKYKKVITLFDNDEAGILGMERYNKAYDLPGILVKLENDMAENVKEHGILSTREIITPLLVKKFKT